MSNSSLRDTGTMRAVRYAQFGAPDVLAWVEVPRPRPRNGEVLVKVAAAAVNPKDCLTRKGKFKRLSGTDFPRSAGYDFSGTVLECGAGNVAVREGTAVFGMLNGWDGGTYAEYVIAPANELAPAPKNIPLEESAGLPLVGQTNLQALRDLGHIASGMSVIINGGSGGVGTNAIQIAKICGAKVTAVCSARNAELAHQLGADATVDYAATQLTELPERFDIFYDVFGNQSFRKVKHLLAPKGIYITTVPSVQNFAQHLMSYVRPGRKSRLVVVRSKPKDLHTLAQWADAGRLHAVTDRRFAMKDACEAHRYVETRRARGKVLLIP